MKKETRNINERVLLLGNEAIARGAIEAGVKVATSYPGTPSVEVLESLVAVAPTYGIYVEWSINEKVAFEVAVAASLSGLRSLVSLKMVGLNVASDTLMVTNYAGVKGGFVIVVCDDPGGHSSQNEQDSRGYAKIAEIPVLEPSSPQEAKDMTMMAFDISEMLGLPVMIRSVTRLSHGRSVVVQEPPRVLKRKPALDKEKLYTGYPAPLHHKRLHEKIHSAEKLLESFPLSNLWLKEKMKFGVISSGLCFNYAREAINALGIEDEIGLLKVGATYPFPTKLAKRMIEKADTVMVIEEGEPYLEEEIRRIAYEFNRKIGIRGKLNGDLVREGELSTATVLEFIANVTGKTVRSCELAHERVIPNIENIRQLLNKGKRPISLCPGCPHLGTIYSAKQAIRKITHGSPRKRSIICSDIGCYTVPLLIDGLAHTHFCMGAGIGLACGFAKSGNQEPVIAFIGDGTFFHAGIPALINAVVTDANITVIIVDNSTTAMTGFQTNPGVGLTAGGEGTTKVEIEDIVRACQVPIIKVCSAFDIRECVEAIENGIRFDGPSVVIAKGLCAQVARRQKGQGKVKVKPLMVDVDKCTGCRICVRSMQCSALEWVEQDKIVTIDPVLCNGCSLCKQICKEDAIR